MSEEENALKSVFKGGSISFLGTIISKGFTLLYRVLIGNFLGPANYGLVSLAISIFSVAENVSALSIPQGVHNYVAKYKSEPQKARGTIISGMILVFTPSILSALTLWIFAGEIAQLFGDPGAAPLVKMIAIVLPIRIYGNIFVKISVGFKHIGYEVISERIWSSIVQIVLTGAFIWLGYNYVGAAAAYLIGMGSAAFVALYLAFKSFPQFFRIDKGINYNFNELFHHSWPLMAAGMFGIINGHIDTFMIQYFLGSEQLGIYQAAYPLAMLLTISSGIFDGIFHSNASELLGNGKEKEVKNLYKTVTKWISFPAIPLFSILLIFPQAPLLLFGSEFTAGANALRVLSIGLLISTITGPMTNIYQIFDRTRINMVKSGVLAISNILLNTFLVPSIGIIGAAIATTVSLTSVAILDFYYCNNILNTFPLKKSITKIVIASALSISSIYLINNLIFSKTPLWFYIIDIAIFSTSYTAILLASNVFESEDLIIIESVIEKFGEDLPKQEKIKSWINSKKQDL